MGVVAVLMESPCSAIESQLRRIRKAIKEREAYNTNDFGGDELEYDDADDRVRVGVCEMEISIGATKATETTRTLRGPTPTHGRPHPASCRHLSSINLFNFSSLSIRFRILRALLSAFHK
ncbi:hypothetical protein L1887_08331 [Cichorium endivia]|nr:hypothetical protein L1887_08331 [Cichorium endivia]